MNTLLKVSLNWTKQLTLFSTFIKERAMLVIEERYMYKQGELYGSSTQ